MSTQRTRREGMALLMVLLLVGVMSAIAVLVLDDVRFSTRRVSNTETGSMAQWYGISAERLARRHIRRLHEANLGRTPIEPVWDGRVFTFPIESGAVQVTLRDGQSCFNLNSVVQGTPGALIARETGISQLVLLARGLGLAEPQARTVANSLADWIDSDDVSRPFGGEDGAYAGLTRPLRTSGALMVEASELRTVRGVDPAAYRTLRPFICALPTADLSPLNPNTLAPADAPLLAMLGDGVISLSAAREAIASRPTGGWDNLAAFWSIPALRQTGPPGQWREQLTLRTRFFDFHAEVAHADATAVRTGLFEIALDNRIRTVISRWIPED
jgi:general secretion pathway protein K